MDEPRSDPTDPTERLAFHLGVTPALLAAKFKDLGLRVVNDTSIEAQEAAGKDWMRKLRNGTLSERKIVGQS